MAERGEAPRRAARSAFPRRNRKRWAAAAGVAVCWLILLHVSGSLITATLLLALLAGLGAVTALAFRALGLTRDHPWVQKMRARPWRDGQEVLQLALRHLPEVFVVTPSGSLLAPDLVEVRLNPADVQSLSERMDFALVCESAAEVYLEQASARGARLAGRSPAEVRVIADPAVPQGRYRLRQGQPVNAGPAPGHAAADLPYSAGQPAYPAAAAYAGPEPAYAGPYPVVHGPYPGFVGHDGNTLSHTTEPRPSAGAGTATVIELSRSPVPALRLVTRDRVAETRTSGARAGRGAVELALPDVPTVSREHARFTFSDGRWWIANLGRNGLTLNGSALVGEQPLGNGDVIRWGMRSDTLASRVEIG